MDKSARILTVCQRGNCRSVALATLLKDGRGYDNVLVCGVDTTSLGTLEMLCNWADHIFVPAGEGVRYRIPEEFNGKVVWFNIGGDKWNNPQHPELIAILDEKLREIGL